VLGAWRRVVMGAAMNAAKVLVALVMFGLRALPRNAAPPIPDDAANRIGQNATVCGVVALTNFDADTQFWPTFLDFGTLYPHQVFTAVIYGADRAEFGTPGAMLQGKRVCVSGAIREYRSKPEIVLNDPRQLDRWARSDAPFFEATPRDRAGFPRTGRCGALRSPLLPTAAIIMGGYADISRFSGKQVLDSAPLIIAKGILVHGSALFKADSS
jgi:hypothetical protein